MISVILEFQGEFSFEKKCLISRTKIGLGLLLRPITVLLRNFYNRLFSGDALKTEVKMAIPGS